ncbi:MAG: hypothetical protein ACMXX7_00785 [Candidatus Woesearchaeota archaeon]
MDFPSIIKYSNLGPYLQKIRENEEDRIVLKETPFLKIGNEYEFETKNYHLYVSISSKSPLYNNALIVSKNTDEKLSLIPIYQNKGWILDVEKTKGEDEVLSRLEILLKKEYGHIKKVELEHQDSYLHMN